MFEAHHLQLTRNDVFRVSKGRHRDHHLLTLVSVCTRCMLVVGVASGVTGIVSLFFQHDKWDSSYI